MTVKMKGPEGHSGLSHQGNSYVPDADGVIEVPHETVGEAINHGFTIIPGSTEGADTNGDKVADLTKLKKSDLLALAKEKFDIDLDASKTNKELIAEIEAAAAAQKPA